MDRKEKHTERGAMTPTAWHNIPRKKFEQWMDAQTETSKPVQEPEDLP